MKPTKCKYLDSVYLVRRGEKKKMRCGEK